MLLFSLGIAREIVPTINTKTNYLYIKDINGTEIKMSRDGSSAPSDMGLIRDLAYDQPYKSKIDADYSARFWQTNDQVLQKMTWGRFNHLTPYDIPVSVNLVNVLGMNYFKERVRFKLAWSPLFKINPDLTEYQLFAQKPDKTWELLDVFYDDLQINYDYLFGNYGNYAFKLRAIDKRGAIAESDILGPIILNSNGDKKNEYLLPAGNKLTINIPDFISKPAASVLARKSYGEINRKVSLYSQIKTAMSVPYKYYFIALYNTADGGYGYNTIKINDVNSLVTINYVVSDLPRAGSYKLIFGLYDGVYQYNNESNIFFLQPEVNTQNIIYKINGVTVVAQVKSKYSYLATTNKIPLNYALEPILAEKNMPSINYVNEKVNSKYWSEYDLNLTYYINVSYKINNNDYWSDMLRTYVKAKDIYSSTQNIEINKLCPPHAQYKISVYAASEDTLGGTKYLGEITLRQQKQIFNITQIRKEFWQNDSNGKPQYYLRPLKIALIFPGNGDFSIDPVGARYKVSDIFSVDSYSNIENYNYKYEYNISYSGDKIPSLFQYNQQGNTWQNREVLVTKKDIINKIVTFQAKANEVNNFALIVSNDDIPPTISIKFNEKINNAVVNYGSNVPTICINVQDNNSLKVVSIKVRDYAGQVIYLKNKLFDFQNNISLDEKLASEYGKTIKLTLPKNSPLIGKSNTYYLELLAEDQYGNQTIQRSLDFICIIPVETNAQYEFYESVKMPSINIITPEISIVEKTQIPSINFYQKIISSVYKFTIPSNNISCPVWQQSIVYEKNALKPQLYFFNLIIGKWTKDRFEIVTSNSEEQTITFKTSVPGYYAVIDNLDNHAPNIDLYVNGKISLEKQYRNEIPNLACLVSDNIGLDNYQFIIIDEISNTKVFEIGKTIDNPVVVLKSAELKQAAVIEAKSPANKKTGPLYSLNSLNSDFSKNEYNLEPGTYHINVFATDVAGNTANYQSNSFTITSVVDLSDFVYGPNPLNAGQENFKFKMTLGAPAEINIDIYTVSGEKIWKYEGDHNGNVQIIWDGYNRYGELVANGIYHCFLRLKDKTSGETYKKKFTIAVLK